MELTIIVRSIRLDRYRFRVSMKLESGTDLRYGRLIERGELIRFFLRGSHDQKQSSRLFTRLDVITPLSFRDQMVSLHPNGFLGIQKQHDTSVERHRSIINRSRHVQNGR